MDVTNTTLRLYLAISSPVNLVAASFVTGSRPRELTLPARGVGFAARCNLRFGLQKRPSTAVSQREEGGHHLRLSQPTQERSVRLLGGCRDPPQSLNMYFRISSGLGIHVLAPGTCRHQTLQAETLPCTGPLCFVPVCCFGWCRQRRPAHATFPAYLPRHSWG